MSSFRIGDHVYFIHNWKVQEGDVVAVQTKLENGQTDEANSACQVKTEEGTGTIAFRYLFKDEDEAKRTAISEYTQKIMLAVEKSKAEITDINELLKFCLFHWNPTNYAEYCLKMAAIEKAKELGQGDL